MRSTLARWIRASVGATAFALGVFLVSYYVVGDRFGGAPYIGMVFGYLAGWFAGYRSAIRAT